MNMLAAMSALALVFVGCALFYLSSPHQRWRASPLRARGLSAAFALSGLYTMTHAMDVVPAVFTMLVWTMLLLVAFPYLGALRQVR